MIRCYVTDRRHGDLLSHVNIAIRSGIEIIQVREKDLDARELYELVCRVRDAASGTATKILVNDRLDIALAANLDGVHLPANGLPAAQYPIGRLPGFLLQFQRQHRGHDTPTRRVHEHRDPSRAPG